MHSDIQQETFNYISSFIAQHARPPRLKDLSEAFNITNKAVLDRLSKLEKYGFIEMPNGVLSLNLKVQKNDVFISYAHEDQEIAEKIFQFLENEGFKVWKDNVRLKPGDNFINEITHEINNSRCVLVLISQNSIKSRFVQDEVFRALEMQHRKGQPYLLPIKIENLTIEQSLEDLGINHLQRLNFNIEPTKDDLLSLAYHIHTLAYREQHEAYKKQSLDSNAEFLEKVRKEADDLFDSLKSYMQVEISPAFKQKHKLEAEELEKIMQKCTVKIKGWGGAPFPVYSFDYGEKARHMANRIKYEEKPSNNHRCCYWSIDDGLNFFYRTTLKEDSSFVWKDDMKNKFTFEWLILDICTSLMFLQKLSEETKVKEWNFKLEYLGIKGRELLVISNSRIPFNQPYQSNEDSINFPCQINETTDLQELAFNFCSYVFRIFNWKSFSEKQLKKDIEDFFKGQFPAR